MDRAYSVLTVKSVEDEQRIIEGIASTPTPDRMDDIVEPKGAQFTVPMPLLWQHRSDQPVGHVEFAEAKDNGIHFRAKLAKIDEPGRLKDRLDEAWQSVKTNLVRGVSIGFKAIERSALKGGGIRFIKWDWLELSLVTVPANAEASIHTIRSIDSELLAASGAQDGNRTSQPGGSGNPVKLEARKMAKVTIAEQISACANTRAAAAARMNDLMQGANERGESLGEAEAQEYDGLEADVKSIDADLVRLRNLEEINKAEVIVIDPPKTAKEGSDLRARVPVSVKGPELPKGTAFTRYAIALARAKGSRMEAFEIARNNDQWCKETPQVVEVLKAAVAAGTTTDATWAAPLVPYQQMASEFIEFLRPMTVLGKIPGLRRVPFNIQMPRQTAGSSTGWVGEAQVKPVSKLAFDTVNLRFTKAAGIVVLTEELVRFSNPSAEALVRQDLAESMAQFLDEQFLDPTVAAVTNVSPASITNGANTAAASGSGADDLRADVKAAFTAFQASLISPTGVIAIMEPSTAVSLAFMVNPLGQPEFPGMTIGGGSLLGMPVVLSESTPSGLIIFVKASEILLADDGGVTLDVSREASLVMEDSPSTSDNPTVSLWQRNMVALRAERFINWMRRRDDAVYYITGADYGATASA